MNLEIKHAIFEIKANKPLAAQSILVEYLKNNPEDIEGWACLYSCLSKQRDRGFCLKRILTLEPNNEHASSELRNFLKGGNTFIDFPIMANLENISISSPAINPTPQKSTEEKPLPVNIIKRTVKYNYADDKEINQSILKPKFGHSSIRHNGSTANVLSKMDLDAAMYGNRLIIRGLVITPHDYPKCIEKGYIPPKSNCNLCEFFSSLDCPILYNPSILQDVKPLFSQNTKDIDGIIKRRDEALRAIYEELRAHGKPLHYGLIARIIFDRYPRLKLSPLKIARLMNCHPEMFDWVDQGVYQANKNYRNGTGVCRK